MKLDFPPRLRAAFGSIRVRLLVNNLLLTLLPLGILGWFMLWTLNRFYLERLQVDMSAEAGLLEEAIAADLAEHHAVAVEALVTNPPPPLNSQARVLVFDRDGKLVASSSALAGELLVDEPGVHQALAGSLARGVDHSPLLSAPVAYVAEPVTFNHQVVGVVHLAYALTELDHALTELRTLIIVSVVALGALAAMLSLELSRHITEPLDQLQTVTHDIASGHFERRVSEVAPTELASVARSFNQMTEILQNAERARQTTFANLAHDIRTPLGSIRAAAEALNAGAVDDATLRDRFLSGLIQQVQYLNRLTGDLLRLATYESGGLRLNCAAVVVEQLFTQAQFGIEAQAQAQHITLVVQPPDARVSPIWADPDRIVEALFNLLDNALRYTPPNGHIRLWAESRPGANMVCLHVSDDGPGIPPEALPHLFERHWRGDKRRAGSGLNMGLGLNIAHEIVSAHGGAIGAANLPDGVDFYFTLPTA